LFRPLVENRIIEEGIPFSQQSFQRIPHRFTPLIESRFDNGFEQCFAALEMTLLNPQSQDTRTDQHPEGCRFG
jgi:hypothetical protein